MDTQAFVLLKNSTQKSLVERAGVGVACWSSEWMPVEPTVVIRCVPSNDQSTQHIQKSSGWLEHSLGNGSSLWVLTDTSLPKWIESMLFHPSRSASKNSEYQSSSIAADVVKEALDDLMMTLIRCVTNDVSVKTKKDYPPARGLFQQYSGAALCSIELEGSWVRLLLPYESIEPMVIKSIQGSGPRLTPLREAISFIELKLEVQLSQIELTLSKLETLLIDDVLTLPMNIDTPLYIVGPGDAAFCRAHLGILDGSFAAELIRSET